MRKGKIMPKALLFTLNQPELPFSSGEFQKDHEDHCQVLLPDNKLSSDPEIESRQDAKDSDKENRRDDKEISPTIAMSYKEDIPHPIPYKKHFRGYDYTQVCRGKRSCIYEQKYEGAVVGYEVFLIRVKPEIQLYDRKYPIHEEWPHDNDFGKTAWATFTLEQALSRFNKLES